MVVLRLGWGSALRGLLLLGCAIKVIGSIENCFEVKWGRGGNN